MQLHTSGRCNTNRRHEQFEQNLYLLLIRRSAATINFLLVGFTVSPEREVFIDYPIVALAISCETHLDVNSENSVFLSFQDLDVRVAILLNVDHFPGASSVLQIARNHVAVRTSGQTSLQGHFQIVLVTVERNESRVPAAERDLIVTVVPPIVDIRSMNHVAEANHVVNLSPAVFADPTVSASAVRIDSRRHEIAVAILRWSLILALEVEGTHYARCAERMCQHEGDSHLRVIWLKILQMEQTLGYLLAMIR